MRRVEFTQEDDALLMKYIATYNPQLRGRLGMKLYERLVENAERKWSFSIRHSVQAWRERYKNNQPRFDAQILKYQKKHGISADTFDNSSSHSTVQSGVRTTLPVGSGSRANIPVGENGAKKRRREVDSEDTNLDSGVAKKMRREKVSVQGSKPCDSLPQTRSPSPSAASVRLSRSFSPTDNAEVNPSLDTRKSPSPCLVGTTAAHEELSPSHQQHDSSFRVVAEASGLVKSVVAPPQLSQEPTPPHTSAINSPRSPLQRQPSPTNGAPSQPGTSHMSSISQKQKRIPPPQRKRTMVPRDDDDIFSTPPPPQVVRASPLPRTSGREAPHLVDGPFRSAYTTGNGQLRPMLRGRSLSGTDEEAEADGEHEEWPPRRGKRESLILSEGLNSTPSRGREQPIAKVQPQRPPSSALYAPGAVPVNESSHPSVNDPFRVPLINREARRWTLADDSKIPRFDACGEDLVRRASVQHIDLRALHSGKSVGTSMIGSAMSIGRSGTSESSSVAKKGSRRPSRSSTPSNLTESNKELVLALGLEAVYSRMAKNHKFHIDLVRKVAARQRSLEDADRMLRNLSEAASREYVRLLRQEEAVYSPSGRETGEGEDEDKDVNKPGDEEDDSQPVRPSPASLGSYHSPMSLVPQGRAKRLALKITTASPDSSPPRPSEYSPPTPTRARAFVRLERQGRIEEARLREAHRVRRSLRPNGAEASPEADEQRITTYLLQLQEGDARDNAPPGPLDSSLDDAETAEVEEQVHADSDCQTLSDLQVISPEAELHVVSTGVDDGAAANGRPTPLESVLTEKIRHNGFLLEREYAAKETSSLACSPLATLSILDAEWTNSDDELLLDGDLIVHEELVRRKGLGPVKFRTAHLYSLLLDS